ncbi:structural maintenance of chromosomes protein 2-2 [Trichonephila clavipes]|uniref:Structural maintenance of chromosomes protein 2-2 n=1 Tax=Trichonephila clavipes TaxID=2585209 RepID=A0A8X6RLC9_TRICX|nr:structural maintenance of chromosomes protein 2-2 [Trichonephila clavipes]
MTLADCRRPLFARRMKYRSSPAVVVLERPPPTFLTAVPVVWNAFKREKRHSFLLIPNSAATLVTVRPCSSFPIILPRVKSSRGGKYYRVPCTRNSTQKTFGPTEKRARTPCVLGGYLVVSGIELRPSELKSDALIPRLPTAFLVLPSLKCS